MAVVRRHTATAISSQILVAQATNLGSDRLCFALDALVGARWHIASHNARDIARTALDAFGGATLGGYGSRRPANGVAAHRDAHAYLATLHRARRYQIGSAEDADYGGCPNDSATPRGPNGETASGTQIAGAHPKSPRVVRSPGVASPDPWRAHAAKGLIPGRFCTLAREAGFLARRTGDTDFLPPGACIAQRVVFGSDDEDGWRATRTAFASQSVLVSL